MPGVQEPARHQGWYAWGDLPHLYRGNGKENGNYRDYIGIKRNIYPYKPYIAPFGVYRGNGKENGNYDDGFIWGLYRELYRGAL